MAAKKKAKRTPAKAKRAAGKKITRLTKTARRKPAGKKTLKKKPARKKTARKTKVAAKAIRGKTVRAPKGRPRKKGRSADTADFPLRRPAPVSGQQAGDLQGLSRVESADSESVDELLEEGNAFEAEAVMGVEDADATDEEEVHTHELPEDDVPDEYLDKD